MSRKSLQKTSRAATLGLGLLLALSVALFAGCVPPQPTPDTAPNPTATMAPGEPLHPPGDLPAQRPDATTPSYDIPHGRLLAHRGHFGEFGGVLYEGGEEGRTMHVYITEGNFDPALLPEARERFDRLYGGRPNQEMVVHRAQYPWSLLQEWSRAVIEASARDDTLGLTGGGLSQRLRLITLNAAPMRGNRERIEAVLATTGVPRDAVQVNIGCGRIPAELTVENVSPGFKDAIAYLVEAQPQARYGETVDLKLIIRNRTPEPAHIYGGTNSFGFVVTNERGENVWFWECGKIYTLELQSQRITPDRPLEFTGRWEQIDIKGNPVPPGDYEIRGTFGMEHPERLVTDPVAIEILPP